MVGVICVKKIDVHIHSSMWENARLQPGCILASPEEIAEVLKREAKGRGDTILYENQKDNILGTSISIGLIKKLIRKRGFING